MAAAQVKLTGNPNNWPDDWKYLYQERAAIKLDSGISTAESEAEQEVREMANGKQEQLF